ncbi:putative taurine catabolism dioxygenase [Rivularia sp. PCC 7116]|uniref:TauD/TfdA family dioxygenase n=1 Tax=Rivularia sp. PCC 7116 TaxID=373994 RepID=UPI00029F2AE4|nr:TauD/TfdA family dioxygenase [Rivularia sp. PCC 7116]AFY58520.1 putative taurine catabolism dioxygenase [Rivularia sp. PCC 7116]
MTQPKINKPNIKKLASRRKTISISQEQLTKLNLLNSESSLPLIITPNVEELSLVNWAKSQKEFIENKLLQHGGILFRNFKVNDISEFADFIKTIAGDLLQYSYRSTPRTQVSGNIYTSTEYPATQSIPLHNEMSYSRNYPQKIAFYCLQKAQQGGETPIADSRKVFQHVSNQTKDLFIQKKVMYVRNYGNNLDLTWQNVFQTTEKIEVENYCNRAGIDFEWKDEDSLQTRQICSAVVEHPQTGEAVWFNQAHLFHISNLDSNVRESLFKNYKESELPRNAYYGDGSPIEAAVLAEIREVYQQESIIFPWQEGDILLLDNILAAHGRKPFTGSRKVVVGMA